MAIEIEYHAGYNNVVATRKIGGGIEELTHRGIHIAIGLAVPAEHRGKIDGIRIKVVE
jgi:hypothetical protein